jgi:hypothetical protein
MHSVQQKVYNFPYGAAYQHADRMGVSCDSANQSVALRLQSSQDVWRAESYPLVGFAGCCASTLHLQLCVSTLFVVTLQLEFGTSVLSVNMIKCYCQVEPWFALAPGYCVLLSP